MAGYNSEYNSDKLKNGCHIIEKFETYSEELEVNKKKVKITLEFPYTVDPKDAKRFEHMLKSLYLNKIKTGSLKP